MTRDYASTRPVRRPCCCGDRSRPGVRHRRTRPCYVRGTRRKLPAWAIVTAFVLAFLVGMCSPLWDAMPWASGAVRIPTPIVAPHPRVAPVPPEPLCVTTLWRARHTHRPLTRPGHVCRIDDGMWLPDSWRILDVVIVGGRPYLLVQRPRVTR